MNILEWLSDPDNQRTLKFIGGGVAAFVTAVWAVFKWRRGSKPEPAPIFYTPIGDITVGVLHTGKGDIQYTGISEESFQQLEMV